MASIWVDRLLLALARRALRLSIAASWAGVFLVAEDILMEGMEGGGEERFLTEERSVGLLLVFFD